MKTKFHFILLLILYVLSMLFFAPPNLSAQSGWRDSSYFKIQKEKVENLKYVRMKPPSIYYYTLTQSNVLTKWNYVTGLKEFEKKLTIPDSIDYFEITYDEYYYAFAKKDSSKLFYNIENRFIFNDSINRAFSTKPCEYRREPSGIKLLFYDDYLLLTCVRYDVVNSDSAYTYGINQQWWINLPEPNKDTCYHTINQVIEHIDYVSNYIIKTFSGDTLIKTNNRVKSYRKITNSAYNYADLMSRTYEDSISSEHFANSLSRTINFSNIVGTEHYVCAFENQMDSNTILLKINLQNNTYTESKLNVQIFDPIYYNEDAIIARNNPKDSNLIIYKFETVTNQIVDSLHFNFNAQFVKLYNNKDLLIVTNDGYFIKFDFDQALKQYSTGWKDSLGFKIQTAATKPVKYFKFADQEDSYFTLNSEDILTKWNMETGRKQSENKLQISQDDTYFELSDDANYYATAKLNKSQKYYDIYLYHSENNELIRHIETNANSRDNSPLALYMYFGSSDYNEFTTSVRISQLNSDSLTTKAINESWTIYQYNGINHDSLYSESKLLVAFKYFYSEFRMLNYYSSLSTQSPKTTESSNEIYCVFPDDTTSSKVQSLIFHQNSAETNGYYYNSFSPFSHHKTTGTISYVGYRPDSTILFQYSLWYKKIVQTSLDKRFYFPFMYDDKLLLAFNTPNNQNMTIYKFNYPECTLIDSLELNFTGQVYLLKNSPGIFVVGDDGIIRQINIYDAMISKSRGWLNDGIMKVQTATINPPQYFKISADGKSYFTMDYNNLLTKWDMETGKVDFKKQLNIPKEAQGFTISNLDEHYAYAMSNDYGGSSLISLHNLNDTSLVKSFFTFKPYLDSHYRVSNSLIYIFIDDKNDSILTATNCRISPPSHYEANYSVNEIRSFKDDTSHIINIGENPNGVEIGTSDIKGIIQSSKYNILITYTYMIYSSGSVTESQCQYQLNYSRCLSNSFHQIYSDGYSSNYVSAGISTGNECAFGSFTFNSDGSKLAFNLGSSKNNFGIINLDSTNSITRIVPSVRLDQLLFVKNDYLLTSKSDYYSQTGTFYLLNPVNGQAFDSLKIKYNEIGKFHLIPNSDKIFIQSNDGRYRIIDLPLHYSSVENKSTLINNTSSLFPNPATGITNLQVNAEVGTELNISIYDMQGREIHKIFSGRSDSKQLNLMFDAKKYCPNAGAYFIQIERNGQVETVNMIVE